MAAVVCLLVQIKNSGFINLPHSCSDGNFTCLLLFLLKECVTPGVPLSEAWGTELCRDFVTSFPYFQIAVDSDYSIRLNSINYKTLVYFFCLCATFRIHTVVFDWVLIGRDLCWLKTVFSLRLLFEQYSVCVLLSLCVYD